jgi:hypothetical protein
MSEIKIEIHFLLYNCVCSDTNTTMTTTTTNMMMALLFHDADISDDGSECECGPCDAYECGAICECDECCFRTRQLRWEAEAQRAEE